LYYGGSILNKEIKKLIQISLIITIVLMTVIITSCLALASNYLIQYHRVMSFAALSASLLFLLLWMVSLDLVKAYKSGKAESYNLFALRLGIGLVLPVFIYLTGLFKGDKDELRRIFISINNLVTKYRLQKKHSDEMLILLPHCMQNKDCSNRVAEDMTNCLRCGGCRIGEIADITERFGIRTVVAKGGTAARNSVKEYKPDFILAIACERELMSGIGDVGKIPVIGVINQRPNGYCNNTTVDMLQLKETLQQLLEIGCEVRGELIRDASCEVLDETRVSSH
jgi:hypothetical protein